MEVKRVKEETKRFKCLNSECKSKVNLIPAPKNIKKYYNVLSRPKKQRVCYACYAAVIENVRKTVAIIKDGKLAIERTTVRQEAAVLLSDSDSDPSEDDIETECEYDACEIFNENNNNDSQRDHFKKIAFSLIKEFNLEDQMVRSAKFLEQKLLSAEQNFADLDSEFQEIEEKLAKVRNNFYDTFKSKDASESNIDIDGVSGMETRRQSGHDIPILPKKVTSFDFDMGDDQSMHSDEPPDENFGNIPDNLDVPLICKSPKHNILHEGISLKSVPVTLPKNCMPAKKTRVGDKVYASHTFSTSPWVIATVTGVSQGGRRYYISKHYKLSNGKVRIKEPEPYLRRNVAFFDPPTLYLGVGGRVIANISNRPNLRRMFYPGIIGEPVSPLNGFRYLIFFDDGYVQYVDNQDVRMIAYSCKKVWEDFPPETASFIKEYLESYPVRPMLRLRKNNHIRAECNGEWLRAKIIDVDASLAKILFPKNNIGEWIYRGSNRFELLFNRKMSIQKTTSSSVRLKRRSMAATRADPIVEYVNFEGDDHQNDENSSGVEDHQNDDNSSGVQDHQKEDNLADGEVQEYEKKTSPYFTPKNTKKKDTESYNKKNLTKNLELEVKGRFGQEFISAKYPIFRQHKCKPLCVKEKCFPYKGKSPLMQPIMLGWRRQICREFKDPVHNRVAHYVAPCGRRLRSISEVSRFLRQTKSLLQISHFTFESQIRVARNWEATSIKMHIYDISDGVESIPISCVNALDMDRPADIRYCIMRQPSIKVGVNLNAKFLVCCSCTDNCLDKSRCECWQLTYEAATVPGGPPKRDIGYECQRLLQPVFTGIFECNAMCRCKANCQNRVVQHGLSQKLQLFKTARRGWGVRTLHDVPQGSFMCVYVGRVITEDEANDEGTIVGGDDYYAELDFIEVVEATKEGYESDVDERLHSSDDDVPLSKRKQHSVKSSLRKRNPQAFEPKHIPCIKNYNSSLRLLFNSKGPYIIDARLTGNIGRFVNHSCDPNVFVQNIFVDTHDVRLPWIAFFAFRNITAGTELTWDYNYEVGTVAGKVKYCHCASEACRGRLL